MSEPLKNFQIPEDLREYVYRLQELGLIEGRIGEMRYTPELKAILDAAHHILAGGSVSIQLEHQGDPTIVRELDSRFESVREYLADGRSKEEAK